MQTCSTSLTRSARTRPRRWCRTAATVAAAASLALACGGATASAASGPWTVSGGEATGLVESTGNLYWTQHSPPDIGPTSTARVYRAAKTNIPGQETVLYSETRSDAFSFGDLTYANPGTWYGYVAANYASLGVSTIKRVPLGGGPTITLARAPSYGIRDVDTDGTNLYWSDGGGLRRMALGGGPITTLYAATDVHAIGLDASRVFFAAGATIRSVAKTGGASTLQVGLGTNVTAMYVDHATSNTVLYWGESNGGVLSHPLSGGVTTYQSPISGRSVTSVSFDGTRVLWTDCPSVGGNGCDVRKRQNGVTSIVSSSGVGASYVQGDASMMFWGDANALYRYVH